MLLYGFSDSAYTKQMLCILTETQLSFKTCIFKLTCILTDNNTIWTVDERMPKQKWQMKKSSLLPLWSGLLSCLVAKRNPVSPELSYLILRQLVVWCHCLGRRQSPCAESELHRHINYWHRWRQSTWYIHTLVTCDARLHSTTWNNAGCPTLLFGRPHEQFLKWSRVGLSKSIKHKITTAVTAPFFMQNKLKVNVDHFSLVWNLTLFLFA